MADNETTHETLLIRTAKAIHQADITHQKIAGVGFAYLSKPERERYEQLAIAALIVAYNEPVEEIHESVR